MKTCIDCGRENTDEAAQCAECGAVKFQAATSAPDDETQRNWVTLTTCRNLVDADVVASQLEGAGIKSFMPDEFVMQTFSMDSNGFGFARVQVAPKDLEQAREILASPTSVLPPPPPASPPPVPGRGV